MKRKSFLNNLFYRFDNYPRHYFVFWFFIIFFFFIIWKVFSYTVLNYDFYKNLADKQQYWKVSIPVTRWNIYSWTNSWTVLATSVSLKDLAIDPTMIWDKNKLKLYLKDIVYKQICYLKPSNDCYLNLLRFTKTLEIKDFRNEELFVKWIILDHINNELKNTRLTQVLISDSINEEEYSKISSLNFNWVYLNGANLYVNPEEIIDEELVSRELAFILWLEKDRLNYLIRKRDRKYIAIINKLSISLWEEIEDFLSNEKESFSRWMINEENTIFNFLILSPNPHRFYPELNVWSQIIWFVDSSWAWHYWLEWYFNNLLKWQSSEIVSKIDINWRIIDPIWFSKESLVWEWVNIHTTIDRNVQKKAEEILEYWVKKYNANKWTIVVMDPKTWAIITMANYPNFDPNNPWDVYEIEKVSPQKYQNPEIDLLWKIVLVEDNEFWEEFYYDSKKIYLRVAEREELWNTALVKYKYKNDFWAWVYKNDAISWLYEPWSIMKSITVAIWLDSWEITRNSMYLDEWKLTIDNFEIKNVSDKCLWYNSFANALNYSCNVWMIRISQKYGKAIAYEYLNNFWFWTPTNISLDWESYQAIENYEKWSSAKLYTTSYWLWISVTPLQMATAYSVIANGWLYITPRIVDYIKTPDWKILKYRPEIQRRVIKEETSDTMISMLLDSVESWVANNWKIEWYNIAWKTWTSQIAYKWKYETWVWSTIWSFAWFWPVEDPRFVVIVRLDRPRESEYGWSTSAFLFKEMMKYLLDYYAIPSKK